MNARERALILLLRVSGAAMLLPSSPSFSRPSGWRAGEAAAPLAEAETGTIRITKLEIFLVFDAPEIGPVFIKNPISVFEQAMPQKDITSIGLGCNQAADEIRIGTTLHSVMVGTRPLKAESSLTSL